jgi:hypothetical protein
MLCKAPLATERGKDYALWRLYFRKKRNEIMPKEAGINYCKHCDEKVSLSEIICAECNALKSQRWFPLSFCQR